jgi:transcriptional regulator with GAF, ATPase, and Fis domain
MIKLNLSTFKGQLIAISIILGLSFIVKDFVISSTLPAHYITWEIVIVMMLLAVFYYFDRVITNKLYLLEQSNQEIQNLKSQYAKRESQLLSKIMKLEEREREEQLLSIHKKKTVQRFVSHVKTDSAEDVNESILPALSTIFEIVAGVFYWYNSDKSEFESKSVYGLERDMKVKPFISGDGFCGQAVFDRSIIIIDESKIKDDEWVIKTGLGQHNPRFIYCIPILDETNVYGLLEIATFKHADVDKIWNELSSKIIELVNTNKLSQ